MVRDANLLKLLRVKVIDSCLQKKKGPTIYDLHNACLIAIEKYDNSYNGIDIATIHKDIRDMISGKYGYNAPIIKTKKIYSYKNPDYTITKLPVPINNNRIKEMEEVLSFTKIHKKSFSFEKTVKEGVLPANLVSLIRYKAIDECLRDKTKKYTRHDVYLACVKALKEFDINRSSLAETNIEKDVYVMRSNKYGYNAPIVIKRKIYFYSDPNYSITNLPIPLNRHFRKRIKTTNAFLKEYQDVPLFKKLIKKYT